MTMKKTTITIGIIIVLLVVFILMWSDIFPIRPIFSPMPEFSSAGNFMPNVPPFEKWQVLEIKDPSGALVAKIILPSPNLSASANSYVTGNSETSNPSIRLLSPSIISIQVGTYNNINDYLASSDNPKIYGRTTLEPEDIVVGEYYAAAIDDYYDEYYNVRKIYILSKKNILILTLDYPGVCKHWNKGDDPEQFVPKLLGECADYFSVYLPIVEKALSTLEVYDYVDNRGFADSPDGTVKLVK